MTPEVYHWVVGGLAACSTPYPEWFYERLAHFVWMPVVKCPECWRLAVEGSELNPIVEAIKLSNAMGVAEAVKDRFKPSVDVAANKELADAFVRHAGPCPTCQLGLTNGRFNGDVLHCCKVGLALLAAANSVSSKPIDQPESPLAAALRAEMRKILDQPLTVASLRRVGRLVSPAIKALQATEGGVEGLLPPPRRYGGAIGPLYGGPPADPDAPDLAEGPVTGNGVPLGYGMGDFGAMAPAPPIETFGTTSFREMAGMGIRLLKEYAQEKKADREKLEVGEVVEALARAKEAGLGHDVVRRLEGALEKSLGGSKIDEVKTVAPTSVVVSEVEPSQTCVDPATIGVRDLEGAPGGAP